MCRYVQILVDKLSECGKYHTTVTSMSRHSDLDPILRVQVPMQTAVAVRPVLDKLAAISGAIADTAGARDGE